KVEGIPFSMMEAGSFGIPLLATNVFGNGEIANQKSGFLIPETLNLLHIKKILSDFSIDILTQIKLRESTRRFVLEYFNSDINTGRFVSCLFKYPNYFK
ncbi:MAG: hypothetical protein ACK452_05070, partial [Bacteroidota bacterium]